MTDGERLTAILAQYAIPCEKVSFHGKLDALAAGLGIQTQGRLMGDVLDDIAAKTGIPILNLPATKLYKIRVDFQMEE